MLNCLGNSRASSTARDSNKNKHTQKKQAEMESMENLLANVVVVVVVVAVAVAVVVAWSCVSGEKYFKCLIKSQQRFDMNTWMGRWDSIEMRRWTTNVFMLVDGIECGVGGRERGFMVVQW